ncbi:flocculation protein FLO11-like [Lactuca sativa]|uniref:flocculation protein FLO11-like n=1 Tax=Lactuca sativa TaxID=4236 RepID=UPI0022AF5AF6|nr:flocculation protein FLO11-like [Lactuca sativa]
MLQSINDADKPATRGKKPEKGKGKKVVKGAKGPTPKKRKSTKADQSPPLKKKKTQPKRKLILASSSSESEDEGSDSDESIRGDSPPRSPSHEVPVTTEPVSSSPITICISISPITSSTYIPPTSFPIPPPIFSEATKTTTTGVRTNVSNMGDRTSAPEHTHTTEPTSTPKPTPITEPPTSPLSSNDSAETGTFLGGEDMTFDSVYYSPYQVQSDDDDDAPVTKKHIKELHEKIDNLVASSSSSRSHITEAAIHGMVDTFTKAHEASIKSATAAIDASTKAGAATTEKVEKLFRDATLFLESLQGAAESNAAKVNSVVEKLATSFKTKQNHFASLRRTLEADNKSFQTTIEDRLTKLQEDLATENYVMDVLARKTTALKIKSLQLSQTEKEVDSLRSERAVIKSFVWDVHRALSNIIKAHDPILNYSVR